MKNTQVMYAMMRGHNCLIELGEARATRISSILYWHKHIGATSKRVTTHQRTKKKPSERGKSVDHRKTANICVRRCRGTTNGANLYKRSWSAQRIHTSVMLQESEERPLRGIVMLRSLRPT